MKLDWLARPFARVWGRPLDALRLEVFDPLGQGLLHAPRPLPPEASEHVDFRLGVVDSRPGVEGAPSSRETRRIDSVLIRPAWGRDHFRIDALRQDNAQWLRRWEASMPPESDEPIPELGEYARRIDREQKRGRALILVCEVDGVLAGQFSVANVVWGAMSQGMLGYWLARDFVGRGLGALGSAMVIDLVIGELGLHRVEVDVCPENERSLGVCRRLGLREEGLRPRFMHINGAWADHLCFSIDRESLPEGGLVRSRILAEDDSAW